MNFAQKIDFDAMMEPVALRLLGEPAQKHGQEWRYGNRGSLAVDIKKGTWFDHEANVGGGVFDLIMRRGHEQPAAWLRSQGFLGAPRVVSSPGIVKTYDYCDENGTLLFQVVRFEPKGFRQRRPDGRGGWIWNLQDTRRVPYLLPDLVKVVAAGETIYVPEGEKDVDNLRAIGFAATTNPGGCKKWCSEYSETPARRRCRRAARQSRRGSRAWRAGRRVSARHCQEDPRARHRQAVGRLPRQGRHLRLARCRRDDRDAQGDHRRAARCHGSRR
jgi:hypothetical protein